MATYKEVLGVCIKRFISIFLRAIVLQTDSPTACINNPTFRVESPTKPILAVFSHTNRWFYSTIGLSIWWSRAVFHKPYFLQDYRYTSREQCMVSATFLGLSIRKSRPVYRKSCFILDYRYTSGDQCIVSPTFCSTIDTLVKTSVL